MHSNFKKTSPSVSLSRSVNHLVVSLELAPMLGFKLCDTSCALLRCSVRRTPYDLHYNTFLATRDGDVNRELKQRRRPRQRQVQKKML